MKFFYAYNLFALLLFYQYSKNVSIEHFKDKKYVEYKLTDKTSSVFKFNMAPTIIIFLYLLFPKIKNEYLIVKFPFLFVFLPIL